jgi:hypothetical protein
MIKIIRNIKLRITKWTHRDKIVNENEFKIGDVINIHTPDNVDINNFYSFQGPGEIVDIFFGYNMNTGYKWCYKVKYPKNIVICYDENEIELNMAYIRDQKLKKLGI